jgi:hypothetical protein
LRIFLLNSRNQVPAAHKTEDAGGCQGDSGAAGKFCAFADQGFIRVHRINRSSVLLKLLPEFQDKISKSKASFRIPRRHDELMNR